MVAAVGCLHRSWTRVLHQLVFTQPRSRLHSMPAAEIRQAFIEYFKERNHKFIRSSPVIPRKDKTLAFVNAGMNQFKPIFTGEEVARWPRAVNSQKCVRVGGKHNDLSDVGLDGYHHTFFEMLGSWSFGDYFKREACQMAWCLLTEGYGISPQHLYVTYFAGDPALGLPPDHECRDIWRQIGVPAERVLPFREANFWEMGPVGPCGPCTELHYDHLQRPGGAAHRVNAGHSDVTELWNLVFIQHQRHEDGSLTSLPERHVDTGMGLERLAAVLQQVPDNYGTDLFTPLFSDIYQTSGAPAYGGRYGAADRTGLDTAYRTLADHARMVTVTLADGAVPPDNHKLRRVLRRALHLCENAFHAPRLLSVLSDRVAEMLGPAFPEFDLQSNNIKAALAAERESWLASVSAAAGERRRCAAELPELLQLSVGPAECLQLVDGLRELRRALPAGERRLDGRLALQLHTQHGMSEEVLQEVALVRGLQLDVEAFQACLAEVRADSRQAAPVSRHLADALLLRRLGLPSTDDAAKYEYTRRASGEYELPSVTARVLAVLCAGGRAAAAAAGQRCSVVLDRTCFYPEGGGQAGDRGVLRWPGGELSVTDTQRCRDFTLHEGTVTAGRLADGQEVRCELDAGWRLGCMRHHTATHLLLAALRHVLTATAQTASASDGRRLRLEVTSYQGAITAQQISECERLVQEWTAAALPISVGSEPLETALRRPQLTLLAGEVYPDPVRLVSVPGVSCEPCCGTHLLSTADLAAFRVTSQRAAGLGVRVLRAVAGPAAQQAERAAARALHAVERLVAGQMSAAEARPLAEEAPYREKMALLGALDTLSDAGKAQQKEQDVALMERQLAALERAETDGRFVVHHFAGRRPYAVPAMRLLKRRRLPTAIVYQSRGVLSVRCAVPAGAQEGGAGALSAADWLADLTGHVQCQWVPVPEPARMAGLDVTSRLSRDDEAQLAELLVQLLRQRAVR
ncbi:alanine--tRNA ligase, mitochondrial-like [Amphibalanus amphitrite]|nr:alanine--tRNA ligase, mitochondrial-like [Amphibalanus amphitrite]